MSAPIGQGDWVECVDTHPYGDEQYLPGEAPRLVLGAIYCVEAIVPGCLVDGGCDCLALREVSELLPNGSRPVFDIRRFRPIFRPPANFIDSLLQPAPERALEDA